MIQQEKKYGEDDGDDSRSALGLAIAINSAFWVAVGIGFGRWLA
jgi:hypothetical protein